MVNYDTDSNKDTDIQIVTEECHNQILNHPQNILKIDAKKFATCYNVQVTELDKNKAMPYNYTHSKSFLDRDQTAKKGLGQYPMHPSIRLNNESFAGDLRKPNELFKKICSLMSKRPPECKNLSIINPKEEILREYEQEWGQSGSVERRRAIFKGLDEVI